MVAAAQFVKNYFLALPPKFIDTSCQGEDCSGYDTASGGRENGTDCGSASRPVQELLTAAAGEHSIPPLDKRNATVHCSAYNLPSLLYCVQVLDIL